MVKYRLQIEVFDILESDPVPQLAALLREIADRLEKQQVEYTRETYDGTSSNTTLQSTDKDATGI